MKKLISIFLALSLLTGTYSCQERNKVELISANNNNEYLLLKKQFSKADKQVLGVFDFSNEQIKNFSKTITKVKEKIEELEKKNSAPFKIVKFEYRLFINKKGKIDKIVGLSSFSEKIDEQIANDLSSWKMNVFSFEEPKKYSLDWNFAFFKEKDKKHFVLLNSNLPVSEKLNSEFEKPYFLQVEQMPSPIGGLKKIQEKIHYPEIAKRSGIEGRVYIKAYIDENGNVAKAEIIKGLDGGCNEEALKAVKNTKFKPGRQRGKAVKVQVVIPILFKLDSKNFESDSKIVGKWEGKSNKGEIIKIKFFSDGTTNLFKSKSGRMFGKITGAVLWPKFKINYDEKPNALDLIYKDDSISKCVVKFLNNNEIIIGVPKKLNERPVNFNQNNISETWKLKRVK